ncbi:unnamed protein product [Moneuplotes crassus]|uniref:Uncharacterized protein n=1 Tax=Euplotes crassus TaxID=5936 RepID=A0AAD1XPX6_EUPCR|nr:unnamed protein product [Moneuplotes crassus]
MKGRNILFTCNTCAVIFRYITRRQKILNTTQRNLWILSDFVSLMELSCEGNLLSIQEQHESKRLNTSLQRCKCGEN